MSRRNLGFEHVDKLAGDAHTKSRVKTILRTLCGELSVNDAAEHLGVGPSRFHELRDALLVGALESLSPKPPGRPPSAPSENQRVLELEYELGHLRYEVELERTRTQLLLTMPELLVGKRLPPRTERGARGGPSKRTRR